MFMGKTRNREILGRIVLVDIQDYETLLATELRWNVVGKWETAKHVALFL